MMTQRIAQSMAGDVVVPRFLAILIFGLSMSCNAIASDDPTATVKEGAADLLSTLRADEPALLANPCRLYRRIDRSVDPYLDLPRTADLVLGRYARLASTNQRHLFGSRFRTWLLSLSTHALTKFVLGRGILERLSITYRKARISTSGNRAEVPTTLTLAGILSTDIRFRLHRTPKGWQIYDVSVENFGLVSTYRAIFAEKIHVRGIAGTIGWLEDKNLRFAVSFGRDDRTCDALFAPANTESDPRPDVTQDQIAYQARDL